MANRPDGCADIIRQPFELDDDDFVNRQPRKPDLCPAITIADVDLSVLAQGKRFFSASLANFYSDEGLKAGCQAIGAARVCGTEEQILFVEMMVWPPGLPMTQ